MIDLQRRDRLDSNWVADTSTITFTFLDKLKVNVKLTKFTVKKQDIGNFFYLDHPINIMDCEWHRVRQISPLTG